ncbi:MAG: alpha/beta hydrolase [Paracoccaceae bacterium]
MRSRPVDRAARAVALCRPNDKPASKRVGQCHDFEKQAMTEPVTVTYATHPTKKGMCALEADLFLPDGDGPFDLMVWMHSGGFRTGSRQHRNHPRIAAEFARHGIATAFIDYRLARPPAILRPGTEAALPALVADAVAAGEEMPESFLGPRALAVVEDACAFLAFAEGRRADWRLSGRFLLAGSSAGAISALNALWLPVALGIDRPTVATGFSFSGGFAYPSFRHPTGARVLALHGPGDTRVPISSIRRLALATGPGDDPVTLIEDAQNDHGDLRLTPEEPLSAAVARAVGFHRGGAAAIAAGKRMAGC